MLRRHRLRHRRRGIRTSPRQNSLAQARQRSRKPKHFERGFIPASQLAETDQLEFVSRARELVVDDPEFGPTCQ
jgi:hypothetical protein